MDKAIVKMEKLKNNLYDIQSLSKLKDQVNQNKEFIMKFKEQEKQIKKGQSQLKR